ncbi:MAG: YeeE/YedE family protein [Burkholderiaceae bacterium]
MSELELQSLVRLVLAGGFAAAFALGAIAQKTGFCTMGAVADVLAFGDWTRMRQWLLAIAVAVLGTQWAAAAGWIDTANSIYTAPRLTWLASVVGGVLFGFGMVLAGGCGLKSLVRLGGGSLKALVVVIVLGLVAFMTLRGWLALVRVNWIEPAHLVLPARQDLPSLLAHAFGVARPTLQWLVAAAIAVPLLIFVWADRAFRRFDNLLAGLGIGVMIVVVWLISGVLGHVAEHPQTLEEAFVATQSGRMEALSFVAPMAGALDWLMFTSDVSKTLTLGVAAVVGVVAGSSAVAWLGGRFRWEGFASTEDTANHLVGAALMGFGGVTALGCTIGQGVSGVSTLALGSLLAFAAIVAGAALGVKYQDWRVARLS